MLRLVCGLIYHEFGQKFMNEKSVLFFNLFMMFMCYFVHLFVGLSILISLGINGRSFKKCSKNLVRALTQHILKKRWFCFHFIFSLAARGG